METQRQAQGEQVTTGMRLRPLEARGGWVGGSRPWVESTPSSMAQGPPALLLREDPAGPLNLCCLSLIQSCPDPGCHCVRVTRSSRTQERHS